MNYSAALEIHYVGDVSRSSVNTGHEAQMVLDEGRNKNNSYDRSEGWIRPAYRRWRLPRGFRQYGGLKLIGEIDRCRPSPTMSTGMRPRLRYQH